MNENLSFLIPKIRPGGGLGAPWRCGGREAGGTEGLMMSVPGVSEAWRDQCCDTLDDVMSDVS